MRNLIVILLAIAALVLVVDSAGAGGCGVRVGVRSFGARSFGFVQPQVVVSSPVVVGAPFVGVQPFVASPVIVNQGVLVRNPIRTRVSQGGFFGLGFIGPNRARAVGAF